MKLLSNILAVLGFLALCAWLVLLVVYPDPFTLQVAGITTAVLALAWVGLNAKSLLAFFKLRSTRYGVNLAFVTFLVLGILTFLNILAKDYKWRKDFSRGGQASLSQQSRKILAELPQDVKMYYFGTQEEKERVATLFRNYQYETSRVKYEFVDTARRPMVVRSMGVERNGTVVLELESTKRNVKVEGATEEKVTNGLIKLLRQKDLRIYFTVGHGERSTEAQDELGFSFLKDQVEKQGYGFQELNLLATGRVPEDASAVLIGGPQQAFFPKELEILKAWLGQGGRLLVAVDLDPQESGLTKGSRQMAELVKPFGVEVHSQMLVDPLSKSANVEPTILFGFADSRDHPISKDFRQSKVEANFLFRLTTYLSPIEGGTNAVTSLARTSPSAWAESDWASLVRGVVSFDKNADKQGEMSLALAVETTAAGAAKPTRLVVLANSIVATNAMLDKAQNRDLVLNSLAWLASDEQFISIRPQEDPQATQASNPAAAGIVFLVVIILMPLVLVVSGLIVWQRRRKL